MTRVQRWFHEFGRPPRILGLDVARGVAILGMVGAHIGEAETFELTDPSTWLALVHGRSSILFAILAGISIALMTGRHELPDSARLRVLRLNLVGRGATIFLIGLALEMLNTPIAVILTLYGVLYVAVIPFLRWRPKSLLLAAGVLAIAGPVLLATLKALVPHPFGAGLNFIFYGSYPVTVWMVFVLGGMALGRLHIETVRTAAIAAGVGATLMAVGYGLGATGGSHPPLLEPLFAVEPHSGGIAEILGSGGFALLIVAGCLLLARPLRWVFLPIAALGSMPLTTYSLHVVSVALVSGPGGLIHSNAFWALTAIALLALASLWSMFLGRGPLERLVGAAALAMAEPEKYSGRRVDA